jgi:signal transduction histidine kinase/CheY-like chemotaxis protein/ligand-binding sensor domain-containing protein
MWDIVQDEKGCVYFGNKSGVLRFDGVDWDIIEVANKSVVRSLAYDTAKQKIFVGAKGELGYIHKDEFGIYTYVSLLDKIPEKYRNFNNVWSVGLLHGKVLYHTFKYLFIYENDSFKIIEAEKKFDLGFIVNDEFWVTEKERGLLRLIDGYLEEVIGGEIFKQDRLYHVFSIDNNKELIISREKGCYVYEKKEGKALFYKPSSYKQVDSINKKYKIYTGEYLDENKIVLGTLLNGIYVINKQGEILQHYDQKSGLQNDMILCLYTDCFENLWVGSNNGISYVIQNSPFTVFNKKNGLEGNAYTVATYDNTLFVGTSMGLFEMQEDQRFRKVNPINNQCWHLLETKAGLLAATTEGLYQIRNGRTKKLSKEIEAIWTLRELEKENYVVAGTNNGIYLYKRERDNWLQLTKIRAYNDLSRYLEVDSDKNIWVGQLYKGIYRLQLSSDYTQVNQLELFDTTNGLPANTNNYVFKNTKTDAQGELLFGTENGLFKFDKNTNSFVEDTAMGALLHYSGNLDQFVMNENGEMFYQQGFTKGILKQSQNHNYEVYNLPFHKLKKTYIYNYIPIGSSKTFLCAKDGLILYNEEAQTILDRSFTCDIKCLNTKDTLILNENLSKENPIQLAYINNDVSFDYSGIFFEEHRKIKYSYQLVGYDANWSGWTVKNSKEYTNLPVGMYEFKVKAKNIYNTESSIDSFFFEVLVPWYREPLAYVLYVFIAIFLIIGIVKIYTLSLKREKDYLEKLVQERTLDLQETNTQLEEKQADLEIKQEEITTQAEHLSKANEELTLHRKKLESLVQERTKDLEAAKLKAEESDRLKTSFLANMSHEIRTPMNAICGFSDILTDEGTDLDSRKFLASEINSNVYSLLNLFDNILDLAKLETDQLPVYMKDVELKKLIEAVYLSYTDEAKNKSLLLIDAFTDRKDVRIETDEFKLERVLKNLIDNALKYTEKGSVEIGYNTLEHEVEVFVKDTGKGISNDQLEHIFSRFTKIEDDKRKLYRGAGLGLALCRSFVELIGGEIKVSSKVEEGSVFMILLPANGKVIENKKESNSESEVNDWTGKRFLIAEDDENNFNLLRMILGKTGVDIVHATNGKLAVEYSKEHTFDLILMDVKMPVMDGIEATRIIRKKHADLPIIAQTAFDMVEDKNACIQAGCNSFIAKPIRAQVLMNVLKSYMNK